jgi:hypothetical protein
MALSEHRIQIQRALGRRPGALQHPPRAVVVIQRADDVDTCDAGVGGRKLRVDALRFAVVRERLVEPLVIGPQPVIPVVAPFQIFLVRRGRTGDAVRERRVVGHQLQCERFRDPGGTSACTDRQSVRCRS